MSKRLRAARRQVFEEAKATCHAAAGAVPERHPDEILLYLSRDPFQQLQPFLLFGPRMRGRGAGLLRQPQLSLETGQIFPHPNRQNTLGTGGGIHGKILHTLVCLSARRDDFFEKSGIFLRDVTVNYRKL